jgi:hypothetical protein
LDAPIMPTIRAETTAKKKLNSMAMNAPTKPPPTTGTNHVSRKPRTAAAMTHVSGASRSVRLTEATPRRR